MSADPLHRPATLDRLEHLRTTGALDPETHRDAVAVVTRAPPAETWRRILDPLGLALGGAMVVAGLLYVLAFNWTALGRFPRVIAGLMPVLIAGGLAVWRGRHRLDGQVAATAAAALTLGSLATLGFAWPSPSPTWPIVAAWAGLVLPWALATRFAPTWLLLLLAVDAAILMARAEALGWDDRASWTLAGLCLVAVHALGWTGFVLGVRAGLPDAPRWARDLALVALLVALGAFPADLALSWTPTWANVGVTLAFVGVSGLVQAAWLRRQAASFTAVAGTLAVVAVLMIALVRIAAETAGDEVVLIGLFTGTAQIALLVASGAWITWGLARRRDDDEEAP